ncbi:MAG: 50S ribosomal protein L33 [Chloroflexi bacterium]|jgi:large subunit ribosomal protein L33|nr:MAG: 50S ribosomal protein L33 [Chloroflexi bacterium OLB13]MBC6954763.1 50S ribosomal protein L33 [Chloroflexota bacterium]MBV6436172.1 50S ribosomal protein L33 [Anaerolineae bacterium]MDL1915779.1 50S ribosomal protein L33 [Anaerolineae bacterium CFX4]OQY83328.1 MAG: 50S ribosomal protein L33 [Anaerolineae bacterium UTCFX5]
MAKKSKGNRILIKLRSTESGHMYVTFKNRRNDANRLELKKYDPLVRKHVLYRETK